MHKKKLAYFSLFSLTFLCSENSFFAQNGHIFKDSIIGEWQIGTNKLASANRAIYLFKKNNEFEYSTDEEDALIEIKKIRGTYFLKNDTLFVKPTSVIKRVGGQIVKDFITTQNNSWAVSGGILKTVKITELSIYPVPIKLNKNDKSISLNGDLYYKIKR